MGINRVTLSNIINGNPTLETLQKIANCLGVKIPELFAEISEDKYSVSKNEFGNHYSYNDENIFLNAFLPHLTGNFQYPNNSPVRVSSQGQIQCALRICSLWCLR